MHAPLLPIKALLLLAANKRPPLCVALLKEGQHHLHRRHQALPEAQFGTLCTMTCRGDPAKLFRQIASCCSKEARF